MPLYNAKTEGHSLRITKFDSDLNVESSYLTTTENCECPAGVRSTCRHRQMYWILKTIADKPEFWDYDAERVVKGAHGSVEHDLYKTGDSDAPDVIKDRNGEVVLGLCKRCGKAEAELSEPCTGDANVEA